MTSYKISVKTGDKKGAGTDANVYIALYGKGNKTDTYNLDTFFKNDFEKGNIDNYTVDSSLNIPEVQRIELWRDNKGWFSNWYLDWIEVTNESSGITSVFPGMKWIKGNQHYFFRHIDTCLPQNDPFKDLRMIELKTIQKDYQLEVKIPGLPAQVKELPEDEQFSFDYQFNISLKTKQYAEEAQKLVMASGLDWRSVNDVKSVYTELFGAPEGSAYFNDDASFGRQRIASLNTALIKLCTEIPSNFGVTEEMVKPLLEGKTLCQVIDAKRLFIVDLAILEGVPTKQPDLFVPCPLALFYFNNDNHLMPIAIQLYQQKGELYQQKGELNQQKGEDNPVFLPTDPEYTWMLAKIWYTVADATYHQALTHLNFTHFMMEGICVSSKRNLSPSHPVYRLLSPHFLYLLAINSLGLGVLVNSGGYFDKTSNGGINAVFALIGKSMEVWRLDVNGTLPEELKSRGVLDPSVLAGAFHFRDDALLLYDAIKSYVQKYIALYYSDEGSITADYEIQQWGAELVKSRDEGGVGILGVPNNGKFVAREQLVVTLTAIIYTCSVAHAGANFQQYDEYAAPFHYSYSMTGVPPKDKSPVTIEFILKSIANRPLLLTLMSFTKVLSEKATQSLGDFEKQFIVDPPAVKLVEEFRQKLRDVEKTIDKRNDKREYSYLWLQPSEIPNAISI